MKFDEKNVVIKNILTEEEIKKIKDSAVAAENSIQFDILGYYVWHLTMPEDIIEKFTFVKLNESERYNNPDLRGDNIITTLGKQGAEYKNIVFQSPNPQDTIDVSGAGDTFTAAFIVKYFQLKDERTAIQFANRKAAEVVSKRGVVTPDVDTQE